VVPSHSDQHRHCVISFTLIYSKPVHKTIGFFLDRLIDAEFDARKEEASLEAKGGGLT
jgi:hypothetical protein